MSDNLIVNDNDKVYIVIDEPKYCDRCEFFEFSTDPYSKQKPWCSPTKMEIDNQWRKPSWCPLNPLPKLPDNIKLKRFT